MDLLIFLTLWLLPIVGAIVTFTQTEWEYEDMLITFMMLLVLLIPIGNLLPFTLLLMGYLDNPEKVWWRVFLRKYKVEIEDE